ncbi:hypothetical protein EMPG_17071 [Blastomyces silverae]|uniref:F-box domain-containing protein n=1 Tax=Blastomyces silverae TaxID=2060906 RepID=A0A0H1B8P1_9EURO|nr:hypothetical protein EMPG_17071 [Blastomyces silverae]
MTSNQSSGPNTTTEPVGLNAPETTQVTSGLELLPVELQRAILERVPRRDLLNAARVKAISYAARLTLYTTVSLRLAQHERFVEDVNRFVSAGPQNMALVQNLSILNSKKRRALGSVYGGNPYRFCRNGEWRRRVLFTKTSNHFNQAMRGLFASIPNLRTVRWFHLFKMDHETFASLFAMHADTLMGIETHALTGDEVPILPGSHRLDRFPRLRIALYASQTSGWDNTLNPSMIALLACLTRRLNHLVLGDERLVLSVDGYPPIAPSPPFTQTSLYQVLRPLAGVPARFDNFSKLDIIGMDITSPPNQLVPLGPVFDLYNLNRLSLVSCVGTEGFLKALSRPAPHMMSPYVASRMRLKEFCIRYEGPTPELKAALEQFLTSFTGLELLSVLLDDEPEHEMMDHTGIMLAHGPTLKVLVWDIRKRNRHERPFCLENPVRGRPAFLALLSETCPNLEELGVVLNMRLLYQRGQGICRIRSQRPFVMLRLPRLKTLHCREFFIQKGRLLSTAHVLNATKAIATSFLDWAYYSHGGSSPLELLAVGPLNFHDRWIQNHFSQDYTETPDAGPMFYDISTCPDNLMGIAHRLNPLLKVRQRNRDIELDDVEMVRQDYKHTRVFDSYWNGFLPTSALLCFVRYPFDTHDDYSNVQGSFGDRSSWLSRPRLSTTFVTQLEPKDSVNVDF